MTTPEGFFIEGEKVLKVTRSGDTKEVGTFFDIILDQPLGISGWSKDQIMEELGDLFPEKIKRWYAALQTAGNFGPAISRWVFEKSDLDFSTIEEERTEYVSTFKSVKVYTEEERAEFSRLLQYSEETAGYFLSGCGVWAEVEFLTPHKGFFTQIKADGAVVCEWFGFHKLDTKVRSSGSMPHGSHAWVVGDAINAGGRLCGNPVAVLPTGKYIL